MSLPPGEESVEEDAPYEPINFQLLFAFAYGKEINFYDRRADNFVLFFDVNEDENHHLHVTQHLKVIDYRKIDHYALKDCWHPLEQPLDS